MPPIPGSMANGLPRELLGLVVEATAGLLQCPDNRGVTGGAGDAHRRKALCIRHIRIGAVCQQSQYRFGAAVYRRNHQGGAAFRVARIDVDL